MKKTLFVCCMFVSLLFGVLVITSAVFADTINNMKTTDSGWKAWQDPDKNGTPYWDGKSWDSPQWNVANYLQNNYGAGAGWQFWAKNDLKLSGDPDFSFNKVNPGQQAALKLEVAGYANGNELYWYNLDSGYTELIFAGPAVPGAAKLFTPSANWGFAFKSQAGDWFYTDSSKNSLTSDQSKQHFALFRSTDTGFKSEIYWIGVEDLPWGNSDKDFQDMVFNVTPLAIPTVIPEPATLIFLGAGLLGMAGFLRRKFKK